MQIKCKWENLHTLLNTYFMQPVKTATILDTRRIKKDGTYPIKLRITFDRKQQYYPTPYDLTAPEFEKVMFGAVCPLAIFRYCSKSALCLSSN